MKLNKKGTSIIELIISIALLSVILAFMLKLLVDLNNTRTNNTFAKDNQVVRSEIIRTIENDIKGKKITRIAKSSDDSKRRIYFYFDDGTTSYIEFISNTLTYKKADPNAKLPIRKWITDDCSIYTDKIYLNKYLSEDHRSFGFVVNIQIHTANDNNNTKRNNPLDDIQISYFYYSDIKFDSNYIQDNFPDFLDYNS